MKKRTVIIPLLALLIWCLIIAASEGWRVYQEIYLSSEEEILRKNLRDEPIEATYRIQHNALKSSSSTSIYFTYATVNEAWLQGCLNCYHKETGQLITLEDVRLFLQEPFNADGSQRTYLDDVGAVCDYVGWYWKKDVQQKIIEPYQTEIYELFRDYLDKHPELPESCFYNMTPAQANELHKQYLDPSYEPHLENPLASPNED